MPNICTGTMMIRGRSANVDEFINIMKNDDYINKLHFYRIFDVYNDRNYMQSYVYKTAIVYFDCAWSVYCCMFDGLFSYYASNDRKGDPYGTNIIEQSKRLQLEIEIWSQEPGLVFQEYYKICSGVITGLEEYNMGDCIDLYELDYPEFIEKYGHRYSNIKTHADYDNLKQDYYVLYPDMQPEIFSFNIDDKPKYLANLVMVKKKGK